MSTTRTTAALLAAGALLLGACSADGTEGVTSDETSDATSQTTDDTVAADEADEADADATPVATDSVDVAMFRYRPEVITVAAGTTVTFVNVDDTEHTVTAGTAEAPDPDWFDLPLDVAGDVVEVTFDEAGTYDYYCVIHPFMVGTVQVG